MGDAASAANSGELVHPIVTHLRPCIGPSDRRRVARLAGGILARDPRLSATEPFGPGVAVGLSDGPTLHIHDTGCPSVSGVVLAREHRAFLLARDGDTVAMSRVPVRAFTRHCREDLGLGRPSVLVPSASRRPLSLSLRCRSDPGGMHRLSGIARARGRLNVAPYLATGGVWALAGQIARDSGVRVHVAGPPAALCRRANDKIWFAELVSGLLGRSALPATTSARGWAVLAQRVREVASRHASVGVKLPSASGASGNFVIRSDLIRPLPSLGAVADELRRLFRHLGWDPLFPMLVSVWEEPVLVTPSVQLWIPLQGAGEPVVEGVFDQSVEPEAGRFVGCAPSGLGRHLTEHLAYQATLMGTLFQKLGYFGRCSFDSILIGEELSKAELHWIECNGRWGGTSIPMTLANRLMGDWVERPFVVIGGVRGEVAHTLEEVRAAARGHIYDRSRGTGLVFLSPGPAETGVGVDIMSMGRSLPDARRRVSRAMDLMC